jgi:hypothetical protein
MDERKKNPATRIRWMNGKRTPPLELDGEKEEKASVAYGLEWKKP